jgi:hypothetical protein
MFRFVRMIHRYYRCVTPRRRTRGPCGLSLLPPSCDGLSSQASLPVLVHEVSRRVWGFDYAGLSGNSRYRLRSCCLPRITKTSASGLHFFGALWPSPPIPLFALHRAPHDIRRKTRGRADRYSLLVRILHSLLHAGLSRRTVNAILQNYSCSVTLCGCFTSVRPSGPAPAT